MHGETLKKKRLYSCW